MQKTIFGYTNFRFFVSHPHGETVWFATRKERDAARDAMIKRARDAGLSDACDAFPRCQKVCRTEWAHFWRETLRECGRIRYVSAPNHVWGA